MNIRESVAIVLANNEHYHNVDMFSRAVFAKYCSEVPLYKDGWRAYDGFQVFKNNYIRINFKHGLTFDNMEHFDSICYDLENGVISEEHDE